MSLGEPSINADDVIQPETEQGKVDYLRITREHSEQVLHAVEQQGVSNPIDQEVLQRVHSLREFEVTGNHTDDAWRFLELTQRRAATAEQPQGPGAAVTLHAWLTHLRPIIHDVHFVETPGVLNTELNAKVEGGDYSDAYANRRYLMHWVVYAEELRVIDAILAEWQPENEEKSTRVESIIKSAETTLDNARGRAAGYQDDIRSRTENLIRYQEKHQWTAEGRTDKYRAISRAAETGRWLSERAIPLYLEGYKTTITTYIARLRSYDAATLSSEEIENTTWTLDAITDALNRQEQFIINSIDEDGKKWDEIGSTLM